MNIHPELSTKDHREDLVVFILTNRRPENVKTYLALRKHGYTGAIYLVCDDLDPTIEDYKKNFAEEVIVFDKMKVKSETDTADNTDKHSTIIFARNATPSLAKKLGYKYHIDLDDDYFEFNHKFSFEGKFGHLPSKSLDLVMNEMVEFLEKAPAVDTLCMAQTGDYIGGGNGGFSKNFILKRKAMNSFMRRTLRPFYFKGLINEDVNTYTSSQISGSIIMLTTNQYCLHQTITQASSGGMSDIYNSSGTYVKSMYTVVMAPSCAKICCLNSSNPRIHHRINWNRTTPMILNPKHKKPRA